MLTLINKKIVTIGSYWHQKDMIGVGVWYCSKDTLSRKRSKDTLGRSKERERVLTTN